MSETNPIPIEAIASALTDPLVGPLVMHLLGKQGITLTLEDTTPGAAPEVEAIRNAAGAMGYAIERLPESGNRMTQVARTRAVDAMEMLDAALRDTAPALDEYEGHPRCPVCAEVQTDTMVVNHIVLRHPQQAHLFLTPHRRSLRDTAPALDVERLAEAVFRVATAHRKAHINGPSIVARLGNSQDGAKAAVQFTELLAAEYERLEGACRDT